MAVPPPLSPTSPHSDTLEGSLTLIPLSPNVFLPSLPPSFEAVTLQASSKTALFKQEEMAIMNQVIAAKMHIAKQCTNIRKFDVAAAQLHASPHFRSFLNWRTVSGIFKTRMKVFIRMRIADERASGVTYELSESEHLLENMKSQMETVEELKLLEQKRGIGQLWEKK